MMQTSGSERRIPVMKKWSEKKDDGKPVTNIVRLQLNIKRVAKTSVPTNIDAK